VFIQWKGTQVCLDFYCSCGGAGGHFDGWFCYYIKCPDCNTIYKLPDTLTLEPVTAEFIEEQGFDSVVQDPH
jgi:hypothetical protein